MAPHQSAASGSFGTKVFNFFQQRRRDIFFAGVALFALGTVVRRELMMKGVVAPPQVQSTRGALPRVERSFGHHKDDKK